MDSGVVKSQMTEKAESQTTGCLRRVHQGARTQRQSLSNDNLMAGGGSLSRLSTMKVLQPLPAPTTCSVISAAFRLDRSSRRKKSEIRSRHRRQQPNPRAKVLRLARAFARAFPWYVEVALTVIRKDLEGGQNACARSFASDWLITHHEDSFGEKAVSM